MIERLSSLDDPRLNSYRSLKKQNAIRDADTFVAEGATVVERLLRSPFQICSVLISDRKWESFHEKLPTGIPIYRMANDLAQQLVGFPFHCGVMACAKRRATPDLREIVRSRGDSLIIAGDRIVDPENVGAIIRIASAFGADAVLLGAGSADPFSRRVLRVSMGNVLFLPIVESDDLEIHLNQLKHADCYHIAAAVLDRDCINLAKFRFPGRTVIVVGNEFDGVSPAVARMADTRLAIPMSNGTDSLNVAIATGIFAWQFRSDFPEPKT
ncbi:MAG: RNA methyltransferase [Planctomycetaceae bacterium]|nr:RNA methyltransferase [Planctomycetaceae bacterium]